MNWHIQSSTQKWNIRVGKFNTREIKRRLHAGQAFSKKAYASGKFGTWMRPDDDKVNNVVNDPASVEPDRMGQGLWGVASIIEPITSKTFLTLTVHAAYESITVRTEGMILTFVSFSVGQGQPMKRYCLTKLRELVKGRI